MLAGTIAMDGFITLMGSGMLRGKIKRKANTKMDVLVTISVLSARATLSSDCQMKLKKLL